MGSSHTDNEADIEQLSVYGRLSDKMVSPGEKDFQLGNQSNEQAMQGSTS